MSSDHDTKVRFRLMAEMAFNSTKRLVRKNMKRLRMGKTTMLVALGVAGLSCHSTAHASAGPLCLLLKKFVGAVQRDDTKTLAFHTSWGGGFKGEAVPNKTIFAKRCEFSGYPPGGAVCDYLMKNGAVEFSGNNAEAVITCLSPDTRFAQDVMLNRVNVTFAYGSKQRGSNVTVLFDVDSKLGGMLMSIKADGY